MSQERKKVLEMLAEGKISAGDAERLLDKLASTEEERRDESDESPPEKGKVQVRAFGFSTARSGLPKFLRIVVNDCDDKVNIRVPIALVKTGIGLAAMLPSEANEKLKQQGIDLSSLSELAGDKLAEALRELEVNVDSCEGETVRIFCE
jgi:hypothetical protein